MRRLQLTLAVVGLLSLSPLTEVAQAYPRVGVRIGIGLPGYYGPWYGGYPYYYGPGYGPYYGVAPAVVVAPAPVVVQSAPAYSTPLPAPYVAAAPAAQPQPYVAAAPSQPSVAPVPDAPAPLPSIAAAPVMPAPTVIRASSSDPSTRIPTRMDILLQQLSNSNENVRRDSVLDLGRMKAQRAVDPLMTMLAKDSSATVREASARALGLIASPKSLSALIYAAQADNDREVRHSAQFAVEVIRNELRGR